MNDGYCVWVEDLARALEVVKEKMPELKMFQSISGNASGDFIFKDRFNTYIIKNIDFSIWRLDGDWMTGEWVEVK